MAGCERSELNAQQRIDAASNTENRLQSEAIQELVDFAKRNFDSLDKDKDKFLSTEELTNPTEKTLETEMLSKYARQIMNLNGDEWSLFENDGITTGDLDKLRGQATAMPLALQRVRDIRETVTRNFNAISDNDAYIRRQEISDAARDSQFSNCDRAALKATEEDFAQIGHKVGKNSRKIRMPHLEEHVGEVRYQYQLPLNLGADILKSKQR